MLAVAGVVALRLAEVSTYIKIGLVIQAPPHAQRTIAHRVAIGAGGCRVLVTVACGEILLTIQGALVATGIMVVHHVAIEGESLGELLDKVHRHVVLSVVGIARSFISVATSSYHGDVVAFLTEQVGNQLCLLLIVVAYADACRSNQRAVELSLGLQVEHIVLASFAHLGNLLQFASLVIHFDFAHQLGRQVFEGEGAVAAKETLAIDIDFMDGKTVVGHRLVLLFVFQSRHSLQEFFEVCSFGSIESIGIDNRGIALYLHLLHGSSNHHFAEVERLKDGIFFLRFHRVAIAL